MLLGEPPRTQADLNFSLFGIPVRVHPFFWVIAILLGPIRSQRPDVVPAVLIWLVAVFIAILCHEFGHAMAMRLYGYRPWITLYGMGGLASYDPAQASRSRGSETFRQILISFAGPAAGFLLAALLALGIVLAGYREQLHFVGPFGMIPIVADIGRDRLAEFINDLFFVCVLWGIVNLLPVYPLDGGQIAREILLKLSPRDGIRQSLMLSIVTAGALALYGLIEWRNLWIALLFGYLAYSSYTTLQAYSGRGGWR